MKLIFALLALIATNEARQIEIQKCEGVTIGNINHDKEVLKKINESPYQLVIDYDTQTLFFSYTANDDLEEVFRSAYLNLKTNDYGIIHGISGGFANTVDRKSHQIYLGGREGIYMFDFETKTAIDARITDKNIWQLYYGNDSIYFTSYPDEKLHRYKDGTVEIVPELAETQILFAAVDDNQNIYFSNATGLFCYKKTKDRVFPMGNYHPNCFTSDIHGKIFFSTAEGIYTINRENNMIETLARIPNLYGVVIESSGNIIYANQEAIVRLTPSKIKCYVEHENKIEDV